jgi:hypothetical protein
VESKAASLSMPVDSSEVTRLMKVPWKWLAELWHLEKAKAATYFPIIKEFISKITSFIVSMVKNNYCIDHHK